MVAHSKVAADNAVATDARRRLDPSPSPPPITPVVTTQAGRACPDARPRRPPQSASRHGGPAAAGGAAAPGPGDTHFRTFRSQADYCSITRASALLDACGFYWGPLSVNVAHEKLKGEPVGTFLVRDSRQKNCFFAISVKTATGPTSIRVNFQAGRFNLDGSGETFDCLFKLLEHYLSSPRKVLVTPLRRVRLRPLQELCRKSIVATFGRDNLGGVPLNPVLKDYLQSFPFQI
ncbi:suppressor of cytokine signaling 1 [Tachyglossus aculeatus]|uniref:suppressor of cytokine signaling 1 n=1 Tax=Tachyglossus aculeatus TaxID=9261 RepID=UPI0018F6E20C|nr:suppressor of cytokine signaling 1 [Tachyglossus aculeatus]